VFPLIALFQYFDPLYRLLHNIRPDSRESMTLEFLDVMSQPAVTKFLDSQDIPLQKLFKRYASMGGADTYSARTAMATAVGGSTSGSVNGFSWSGGKVTALGLDGFTEFAHDYSITPGLLGEDQLRTLFRDLARVRINTNASGPTPHDNDHFMVYHEFLDLMGYIAKFVFSDEDCPTMLDKLQHLFYSIDQTGQTFQLGLCN